MKPASDPQPDAGSASALLDLIGAAWVSRAVGVAAEINLADALAAGPCAPEHLAARLGVHAPALGQLLRALATIEVVRALPDGRFELAPRGELLQSNHPRSLRAWALWAGAECWPVWQHLVQAVRTGIGARTEQFGASGFGHLNSDAPRAAIFNLALRQLTSLAAPAIVRAIDWSGVTRVVDVGGGSGTLLAEVLQTNPAVTGIVLDLAHAIPGAREFMQARGLAERCRCIEGDFFEAVPAGADVYLLKTVIHDWPDAPAIRILRTCRAAMAHGARLMVIERIMPDLPLPSADHRALVRSDLHMLAAHGAAERTAPQFRRLLAAADLSIKSVTGAGGTHSLIEAVPA